MSKTSRRDQHPPSQRQCGVAGKWQDGQYLTPFKYVVKTQNSTVLLWLQI